MFDNPQTLIGAAFIFVGVVSGVLLTMKARKAFASTRWPHVYGELESAELKRVVLRGLGPDRTVDHGIGLTTNFRYRYVVAGTPYTSTRVTFSDRVNKPLSSLRNLQERYRGTRHVLVYYNPDNPGESVLLPGASLFNFTPMITSALFIVAGVYVMNLSM